MRLFFAIEFSDGVKGAIADAVAAVPVKNPPWRWIAPQNLHLTLKFLGETPDDSVAALSACGDTVAAEFASFQVTFGGLGGFPNLKNPRVLFYRIEDGVDPLRRLAERLDQQLSARMALEAERRPFNAHATIARVKTRLPDGIVRKLEVVPPLQAVAQEVDSFALIQSRLSPQGARYHCLKAFALSKSK